MLKKFSADSDPHLVSLLVTYEQYRRFYLVFHWAEANLQDYWENKNPTPRVDYETILWMAQQCKGIAGALYKIHPYESYSIPRTNLAPNDEGIPGHNLTIAGPHAPKTTTLFGRHCDIKPANILWFQDPEDVNGKGILKVTDIGLAERKPSRKAANTGFYRPPECDLDVEFVDSSYDIWTMGCLYLEFVTWLLGGWTLVEEFRLQRISFDRAIHMDTDTFFEIEEGTKQAKIKSSVTDVSCCFRNLHSEAYTSCF